MPRSGYYNLNLTEDRISNIKAITATPLSCNGYYNLKLTKDREAAILAIASRIGCAGDEGEIPGNTIGKVIDFALQTARFNRRVAQGSNVGEVIDYALKYLRKAESDVV